MNNFNLIVSLLLCCIFNFLLAEVNSNFISRLLHHHGISMRQELNKSNSLNLLLNGKRIIEIDRTYLLAIESSAFLRDMFGDKFEWKVLEEKHLNPKDENSEKGIPIDACKTETSDDLDAFQLILKSLKDHVTSKKQLLIPISEDTSDDMLSVMFCFWDFLDLPYEKLGSSTILSSKYSNVPEGISLIDTLETLVKNTLGSQGIGGEGDATTSSSSSSGRSTIGTTSINQSVTANNDGEPPLKAVTNTEFKLLYEHNGDLDSDDVEKFHDDVDQGPTLTIIRSGDKIFGGYNPNSWSKSDQWLVVNENQHDLGHDKNSGDALSCDYFLFSLSTANGWNPKIYTYLNPGYHTRPPPHSPGAIDDYDPDMMLEGYANSPYSGPRFFDLIVYDHAAKRLSQNPEYRDISFNRFIGMTGRYISDDGEYPQFLHQLEEGEQEERAVPISEPWPQHHHPLVMPPQAGEKDHRLQRQTFKITRIEVWKLTTYEQSVE